MTDLNNDLQENEQPESEFTTLKPQQEHEFVADILLNFVRTLGIFSTERLQDHVERSRRAISMRDAVGPILGPTRYRDEMYNGTHDAQQIELQITEHIVRIRGLMDKLEALAAAQRGGYQGER